MQDYATGISGIRKALEDRLGISPAHVVMVSDEKDQAWWNAVRLMGWYTPDHIAEQTVEKYGDWLVFTFHKQSFSCAYSLTTLGTPFSSTLLSSHLGLVSLDHLCRPCL